MKPNIMHDGRAMTTLILLIVFGGILFVYTAIANLSLLQSVYPNQAFVAIGLLGFEGGIPLWSLIAALHAHQRGKRVVAVAMILADFCLSGTGFFTELERNTGTMLFPLPPVVVLVAIAIVLNGAMTLVFHLWGDYNDRQVYRVPPPVQIQELATGEPEKKN